MNYHKMSVFNMIQKYSGNKKYTRFVLTSVMIIVASYSLFTTTNSLAQQNSSIDNAVQEVRNATKGKIISADTVTVEDLQQHRIKVLMPNGHVKVFYKPITK